MQGKTVHRYARTDASGLFAFPRLMPGEWLTTLWLPSGLALVTGVNPSAWTVDSGEMN